MFRPPPSAADDPPVELSFQERTRTQAAAVWARRAFPGAIGEYLYRELTAFAEFGYRFETKGLSNRLVEAVLKTPLPPQKE